MFVETKEDARSFFFEVWSKIAHLETLTPLETVVADVIKKHPEYHKILDSSLESERSLNMLDQFNEAENPFLHMGLHIALVEQLQIDRPTGIRDAYSRAVKKESAHGTNSSHNVEHDIMQCLAEILWVANAEGRTPDENAYLASVEKLTKSS